MCLFGDKITCAHVRRILGSPERLTTLVKPYDEALALSTKNGHRRILRFLRENTLLLLKESVRCKFTMKGVVVELKKHTQRSQRPSPKLRCWRYDGFAHQWQR
eukprot:Tbor_TRINITY_DN5672_c1_g6::TRINITY_DN5672_c1_g6_i3::g.9486::m.9486